MAQPTGRIHGRRTQVERAAATRSALLDATLRCLIESGYGGTTTKDIAARAGVTRGAQAHHYASKAELVTDAVRHLAQRAVAELVLPVRTGVTDRDTIVDVLDRLWAFHRSEVFAAAIELWLAARTDPELRLALRGLERDILDAVLITTGRVLPGLSVREAAGLTSTTLATLRGLALLTFVHDDVDREWQRARTDLLQLWEQGLGAH